MKGSTFIGSPILKADRPVLPGKRRFRWAAGTEKLPPQFLDESACADG